MAQKDSSLYFTTPLYYVNAEPHLGHGYCTILADTLVRHYQQRGVRARYLTGTDEHGEKIAAMAQKAAKPALDFATEVSKKFEMAWSHIGLKPDMFYRTTAPAHRKLVQKALQQLKDRGEIYFARYTGKYCVGCERFRTDNEWGEDGLCPDHRSPPEEREEANYFFKMSAYQEALKAHYAANPKAIQPAQYMKETLAFLDAPLEDLCISRPTSRLEWGIPLPFDSNYVTYVWFDALLSYLGGLGYDGTPTGGEDFDSAAWRTVRHLIGKDILKTHAVYWPTMLLALRMPLFERLQVSGFWLTGGLKMSKSLGNVVSPVAVQDRFGIEPFRYFLLREMSYGSDANFTWDSFVHRANSELANGLGNLASRVLTLVAKNFDSKVPAHAPETDADRELLAKGPACAAVFEKEFDAARYHMALASMHELIQETDRYINNEKPWALAKDPANRNRLGVVLGTAMESLRVLAVLGASVLPKASADLAAALGMSSVDWNELQTALEPGTALAAVPRLFPRLELPQDS